MTARWSGAVLRQRGGNAPERGWSRSRTLAGFPTAPGGQSPEVVFIASARDVNVGCRNGFRGILMLRPRKGCKALTRRSVERRTRPLTRMGSMVIVLAARVLRAGKG
jgi:hypothetical protein